MPLVPTPANPTHSKHTHARPHLYLTRITVPVGVIIRRTANGLPGRCTQFTPIGVFAIAANAAGTMSIEEFWRLQTYILTFIVATLMAAVTPFSYREVMRSARDALVTGFMTGNLFIVLPMLVENGKRLFEERRLATEDTDGNGSVRLNRPKCPGIATFRLKKPVSEKRRFR